MAATPPSSSLQIAQIIADLQTLQNADPTAALALLSANKTLSLPTGHNIRRKSKADTLNRRIVGQSQSPFESQTNASGSTPSLARGDSLASSGFLAGSNSGTETPVIGSAEETDPDLQRAKTLLELWDMRDKFKQMGDTGLKRSKQRVDDVVARYAKMELEEREKVARARHLGVPA